jgi:hypothetical protein
MDIYTILRVLIVLAIVLLGTGTGAMIVLLIKGIPEVKMIWRNVFHAKKG